MTPVLALRWAFHRNCWHGQILGQSWRTRNTTTMAQANPPPRLQRLACTVFVISYVASREAEYIAPRRIETNMRLLVGRSPCAVGWRTRSITA
eukprot:4012849-Pyramimonas_sp.AAC.1